jgi:hypothetical protein
MPFHHTVSMQHMLLAVGIKAGHVTAKSDLNVMQLVGAFWAQRKSEVRES